MTIADADREFRLAACRTSKTLKEAAAKVGVKHTTLGTWLHMRGQSFAEISGNGPREPGGPQDHCSQIGAARIAARIESYWRARGYAVTVHTVSEGFTPSMRSARYDVRSDMVSGWPQRRAA